MRLIGYNYTQQPETTITASSSNVNYPVSNIKHEHRAKEWRSKGSYEITLANNSGDTGVGAFSISVGTYSALELAELVSTATGYEVTFSETTGLWTISNATNFSLLNSSGVNAGKILSLLGFAASDYTGANTYTGSNISIHTSENVVFDLRTTEEINSVVILWAKEDGIKLSNNAVIKIQANATNEWSSPAVDQALTIDNDYEVASHYFSSDQSYRYWRVLIQDPKNAYLYVNLGVVVLGKAKTVDNPDNGFIYSNTDNSKITSTEFGHEYVDEYPSLASLELNFEVMDYDSAKAFDLLYRQVGNRKPVYVCLDHTEAVFNKNHFAIYGKFRTNLSLNHIFFDTFQGKLTIGEVC